MDRQKIERCLEVVAAYRATGQSTGDWAAAHGLDARVLRSWCSHAQRWQARLDGADLKSTATSKPQGFVAACVAPRSAASSVRLEINSSGERLELHWPLTHMRELAVLVRELGR